MREIFKLVVPAIIYARSIGAPMSGSDGRLEERRARQGQCAGPEW